MAVLKGLLCFFFLSLALLPFFLPSHCHAYPLDISKFLQRHRKSLHRLAQIRRRDSWDDSGFGSFGHFVDAPVPTDTRFSTHHQMKGQHDDGFGGEFTDHFETFGHFGDTGGFGDFDPISVDGFIQESVEDDKPFSTEEDDVWGDFVGLPPKSDPFESEWTHKIDHHGSRTHLDGFVNKGFNDVVLGKHKPDINAPEYSKFRLFKPLEGLCERKHHSCWQDSDCHVCGPLYSCRAGSCKVMSSSGDAGLVMDDEGREWFNDGYFVNEPFDSEELGIAKDSK